jgi:hypothetical protein
MRPLIQMTLRPAILMLGWIRALTSIFLLSTHSASSSIPFNTFTLVFDYVIYNTIYVTRQSLQDLLGVICRVCLSRLHPDFAPIFTFACSHHILALLSPLKLR